MLAEEARIELTPADRLTTVLKTVETTRSHQLPLQSIQDLVRQRKRCSFLWHVFLFVILGLWFSVGLMAWCKSDVLSLVLVPVWSQLLI